MSTNARVAWCTVFCIAPVLPITARLSSLQIMDRNALASKASEETQRISLEIAPRGRLVDRFGNVLAESLPSRSCFLDPRSVRDPARIIKTLSAMLRIPAAEIRRKLRSSSRFVLLKRKMMPDEADALERLRLEGVGIVADQERYYPNGDLALNVLGGVNQEGKGASGLELQLESSLAGKPLHLRWMRDGAGKAVMLHREGTVQAPPDIRLTLNRDFQHYAEAALDEGIARYHPEKGLIMIQDPRSGDILAVATYPHDRLRAFSMQDAYEPGSTYKLVTLSALLEEKMDVPGEKIDGENGRWEVSRHVTIKDHEPSGLMSVAEVLEKSSNIGSAKLGLRLGAEKFYNYSRAFGFGSRTSLAYPGESAGLLKPASQMTRVILANNAFGQGLAVTPLQLLAAYSAAANKGVLMEPRLVLSIGGKSTPAPSPVRRVVSEETAKRMTEMLEGVIERGTGIPAHIPGYYMAGKTGTAQKVDPRTRQYSSTQYIASFIGFAPSRDPKFTLLVVMDSPKHQYYGADVAAPIFAKVMRQLLALEGVSQDRPVESAQPRARRTLSLPSSASGRGEWKSSPALPLQ